MNTHRDLMRRTMSVFAIGFLLSAIQPARVRAQVGFSTDSLEASLQTIAGRYPVRDIEFFGQDSVRVDVEDSSRTAEAVRTGQWMFGPPVTLEEAGGCPPQKVLGRRIARELWRRRGKIAGVEQIIVRVHGSTGVDRLSYEDMYYERPDLDGQWVGDRAPTSRRADR